MHIGPAVATEPVGIPVRVASGLLPFRTDCAAVSSSIVGNGLAVKRCAKKQCESRRLNYFSWGAELSGSRLKNYKIMGNVCSKILCCRRLYASTESGNTASKS
jgi:hypothetical protein